MACADCDGCRVSMCSPGKYGQNCDLSCSVNCRSLPCVSCSCENCNQTSGYCTNGCDFGWYGVNCDSVCPKNCFVEGLAASCDQSTGNCISGCQRGFYGEQCNITCSSFCTDSLCDQLNGTCQNGCIDGHTEEICGVIRNGAETNDDEIAGAIGGAFVVVIWAIVVIVLICFIWKRRLKDIAVFNRNTDIASCSNRSSENRRLHKRNSNSSHGSGADELCIADEIYQNERYCGTRHSRRSRSLYKKRAVTFDEGSPAPCFCDQTGSHEYFIIRDDVTGPEQCVQDGEYSVHFTNSRRYMPKRSCSDSDIACSLTSWRTDQ